MWVRRALQRAEPQAHQKPNIKDPNNQYKGRRAGRMIGEVQHIDLRIQPFFSLNTAARLITLKQTLITYSSYYLLGAVRCVSISPIGPCLRRSPRPTGTRAMWVRRALQRAEPQAPKDTKGAAQAGC
jgi:hypothetical protein